MFSSAAGQFQKLFVRLRGQHKLTEKNITEAIQEVRQALLEADVHHAFIKTLLENIKEKALGKKVLQSISPGQQFIKVVYDELVHFMGEQEAPLQLNQSPSVIMLCGLQGSGKTTHAAKIAKFLKKSGQVSKPLLVACDLQRPAAVLQLQTLGAQAKVDVFHIEGETNPVSVARLALEKAKAEDFDVVILDTAGRLHLDDILMEELAEIKEATNPQEVLFVANATLGQEAVNTATAFHKKVSITGTILTMLDGTARAGAAISIRQATGRPLKFEGIGEKLDDLQLFNPRSMADRILGMGDTINLVRKAQEHVDQKDMEDLEKKLLEASFTYDDFLKQLQTLKKMGPIKSLMKMLPGTGGLDLSQLDDRGFLKMEAMMLSMTKDERKKPDLLENISRKKRIARGSGSSLDEVNRLVKMFTQMKQFFKGGPNMKKLSQLMGNSKMTGGLSLWR